MLELFELRGADPEILFSPYCWRVRLALAHKGLPFTGSPLRFTDKEPLACSGQNLVPVIRDGETVVNDSVAIFEYLDATYPQQPLLGDSLAANRARLLEKLTFTALRMPLLKLLVPRVYAAIDDADKDYFRTSREKALGMTLEAFADRQLGLDSFVLAVGPLEAWLKTQPYLDGEQPAGTDYLVAGLFFWAWCLGEQPWPAESAVDAWFQRILKRYEAEFGVVKRAA
ncbi:glutathione S-transferase family protein [Pseudomonas segetis]|uniref:Glutathione S-transferase n=1 Tax=Pseudomonas segetis TaxID=298908 RepID=A0A239IAP7_9PSED|nr:glutathione S-transferase family protein [Pseudomonas segetis]SNS90655.1 Glutathione S-transferase [Pseudomonas segetis]